jgi:3-oxoacyl-[acyl-carrier protein] reductase
VSIRDKVVLVTGATGAIGQPLADACGAGGARLALIVRRTEAVDVMERRFLKLGIAPFVVPCDLRYEEDVVRMVHRVIDRFGRIDVVINAAAVLGPKEAIEDYPVDPWRNVLATNVTGAYLVCREVLPWMRRQGNGCILNVTSHLPRAPRANWGAYLVSNHAIEGITQSLAVELRGTGVRVHTVDVGMPQSEGKSAGSEWVTPFLTLAGGEGPSTRQQLVAAQVAKTPKPN